jgi:hypothetical protein
MAKKVKVIGSRTYFQPWADVKRHEGYGLPVALPEESRTVRRLRKKAAKKGGGHAG